jgi:hypothetical protein
VRDRLRDHPDRQLGDRLADDGVPVTLEGCRWHFLTFGDGPDTA